MTQAIRMLLAEGVISRDQFEDATLHQATNGGTIGNYLVERGHVSSEDLVGFFARRYPIAHWPKKRLAGVSPNIIGLLPPKLAGNLRVLPLMRDGNKIVLGVTDPSASHALNEASRHMGHRVTPVIISEEDMTWALNVYYGTVKESSKEPILLTKRKTRKTSPLRPVSDSPPPVAGDTIEDAIRAIPLVNKIPSKKQGTETMRRMYTKPPPPPKKAEPDRQPKLAAKHAPLDKPKVKRSSIPAAPANQRPAFDSWSKPAQPVAPVAHRKDRDNVGVFKLPANDPAPASAQKEAQGGKLGASRPHRQLTEGELVAAINKASDRDTVIALALETLGRCAKRAIFLVVKRNEIRGFDVVGEFTSRAAAKTFWVPANTPSTFSRVAKRKQIHVGPLDRTPADSVLAASLGGRPDIAVVIPVVIRDRTIGILYADRLDIKLPPKHRLEKLATTVADNLAKILKKTQKS